MHLKFKRFVALLCAVIISVTAVVPVSAASSYTGTLVPLILDDGSYLKAPKDALTGYFIVAKYEQRSVTSFFQKQYRYMIFNFDSVPVEAADPGPHNVYFTPDYSSQLSALSSEYWSVNERSDTKLYIARKDEFTILYSNVDYYDVDGNLVYENSWDTSNSVIPPPVDDTPVVGDIQIVPIRDYSMLPPVSDVIASGGQGVSNDWIIVRKPSSVDYDDADCPIYDSSTEWIYWLIFMADDYAFEFVPSMSSDGVNRWPGLYAKSGVLALYRLESNDFYGVEITDTVLDGASDMEWKYFNTYNDSYNICGVSGEGWQHDSLAFKTVLDNMLVGSSMNVSLSANGPFHYLSNGNFIEYYTPTAFWYSSSGSGSTDGDDLNSNESVSWLEKIYNAIVTGFNNVIAAISGNDVVDDDVVADTEEEDGFSLADIIEDIWNGIKNIIGGLWKIISDAFFGVVGAIGDFFDLIGNSASELFDWFDTDKDTDGTVSGVSGFFGFMGQLWTCIPYPVRMFMNISFALFIFFALLKMFH